MKLLLITLTVLQSLFATLEQNTLQSDFTITVADSQSAMSGSQPMTYSGTLAMHGKQFTLEMFGMEAAYDGSTLYIYSADLEEITLSTPTEEELVETNPFLYAQALLPVCQYAEKVIGDKTQITLIPTANSQSTFANNKSPIAKFILRVATETLLPVSAEIHEVEGNITTLRLTNPQYTDSVPTFSIKKEGVYVNDLR